MKRWSIAAALVLLLGFLAAEEVSASGDVDDFDFSSFEADYYLSVDEEGRSQLRVEERLVAEFPDFDQNKGLLREIPVSYQGRPLSFELKEVRKNGQPEPIYDTSRSGPIKTIATGTDDYLQGTQEYEFIYNVRDVTQDFDDYQEFFWDTNGTGWRQPFDRLEARVHLEDEVAQAFSGDVRCFEGAEGEDEECEYSVDEETVVFQSSGRLESGENVSMVLEFEPGTFQPFAAGWAGTLREIGLGVSVLLSLGAVAWAIRLRWRHRDSRDRGVVVPQYSPPEDPPVLALAQVYKHGKSMQKAMPAQLVDLAVRGKIDIIEHEREVLGFSLSKQYELKLKDTSDLSDTESQLIEALFGSSDAVGERFRIGSNQQRVSRRLRRLHSQLERLVVNEGYRHKVGNVWRPYVLAATAILIGGGVAVEMYWAGFWNFWMVLGLSGAVALMVVALTIGDGLHPLTKKGQAVADHLQGLKDYMQLAESERLQVLQTPKGAESIPIDTEDTGNILKLHERLLPYAVLFDIEQQWSQELGRYYEDTDQVPVWYHGSSGFNASNFSSSMSSLSSSTSSSSSGMSGGASGGGGGGGGGGGR